MRLSDNFRSLPVRQWFNIGAFVLATIFGLIAQIIWDGPCGIVVLAATLLIYGLGTFMIVPPVHLGIRYFLGKLQPDDVQENGLCFGARIPWLIRTEIVSQRHETPFAINEDDKPFATLPNGAPVKIKNAKFVWDINPDDILNHIKWGVEGTSSYIKFEGENFTRHWFESENEGPHNYREARMHEAGIWNAILKGFGCLPPIRSEVPTPVLERYFAHKKPTKIDTAEGLWTNKDSEWEGLNDHLDALSTTKRRELEQAVKARMGLIARFRSGVQSIPVPGLGCELVAITFSVDTTEDWHKREEEVGAAEIKARIRAIELASTKSELTELAPLIDKRDLPDFHQVKFQGVPKRIEEKTYKLGEGGGAAVIIAALEGAVQRFFGGGKKGRQTT